MYLITCKFDIEGYHFWKEAPVEYCYLKFRHRHIFEITAKFQVDHVNRQIEINDQRNIIINYLKNKYGDPCEFLNMSCEAIAEEISTRFNCCEVQVLEDGFCGAIYINTKKEQNYEENRN